MDRKRPGPRRPRSASKHDRIIPTHTGDCRGQGPALAAIRIIRESEQSTLFRARNNADLLFYHLKLRCYVVIELKAVKFEPGFVGQLGMYMSAVDDLLAHPDDKPTIGLLLCKEKNNVVAEYALRGINLPIGVSEWQSKIIESLPEELASSLPSIELLEAELADEPATVAATGRAPAVEPERKL
ncbi:PDDEXK nuclease domain-containing protein [Arthrobacter sp. 2RAF6]|uniref:PDDEXK nuclease domain-containing protein n=1 Tax=Arthrobacter sp. 2RAF6 TaxID=3233002 RepID=UPI003F911D9D